MSYMRFVCLLATTLTTAAVLMAVAQSPALQRGVSVQMAVTNNASPMPEADNNDAWIVTVDADGNVYFGIDPFTPSELAEKMKTIPRRRDQKLYIKADARAPFSSVQQVLNAARVDFFDDVVLLTAQPEAAHTGTIVAPKGLDVWIGNEAASNFVALQIGGDQGSATLKVGNKIIAPSALQGQLAQLFDNRAGRIVLLKASSQITFAQFAQAIDACQGAGATRVTVIVSGEV